MGHIWVDVKLLNPLTGDGIESRALVDTDATFTVIPREVYERLNLKVFGRKKVETATGLVELDESFAVLEVKEKRGVTPILISEDLKDILIGTLSLEALGLAVDPTTGELKEARILLL
ncbi:MAG: aspartyl protease family protein [Candidatus Nezhaarchaeales archaeon]